MGAASFHSLHPIPCRHFIQVTILIELADNPAVDQLFDLDIRRFGILRRHEPADIAQAFEGRERLALDARTESSTIWPVVEPAGQLHIGGGVVEKMERWHSGVRE
mgnify:FL=1